MATIYKDVPHLIFKEHESQKYLGPIISQEDKLILRELAKQYIEIASLPMHKERTKLWTRLNSLEKTRPMLWMNEICWNEMNVEGELDIRTKSAFAQRIEVDFRRKLYIWNHMPCDIVFEPFVYSPMIISNSGIGIEVNADVEVTESDNEVISHHFNKQIQNEDDLEKIRTPIITHFEEQTQEIFNVYQELFSDILDVKIKGCPGFWFAPWDDIVTFTGVQEALYDLALRPEYIHKFIGRLTDAYLAALEQYEDLGLISSNNSNDRIGSGAYGYCNDLIKQEDVKGKLTCRDIWGSATPQIFSTVSPAMHEEFALQYEKRWLERFGLSYYGCCEPLDNKIDILKKIKNLRKISISPWANEKKAAEQIQDDYVISLKPNPSVFADASWDIEYAKKELLTKLKNVRCCNVEIIMKDISTVLHQPKRLWEWAKMASELILDL